MRYAFYILGIAISVLAIYLVVLVLIDRPKSKNEQEFAHPFDGKKHMPFYKQMLIYVGVLALLIVLFSIIHKFI